MNTSTIRKKLIAAAIYVGAIGVLATAAFVTAPWWLPKISQHLAWMGPQQKEEDEHDDHGDHEDPDVIEVTPEAQKTLGIDPQPLARGKHDRVVRIPGRVVRVPGVTQRDITVRSSGKITRVYARQGQKVRAGEALFDITLTHEEAIQNQLQLLDALAKLEVVNAEIERLEKLLKGSPGAVPGTRLLTQKYERGHLKHTVASRRQILILLGLPEKDVDDLIKQHHIRHMGESPDMEEDHKKPPLLDKLTVRAPLAEEMPSDRSTVYVIEELMIRQGQHVKVGDTLCRLGDYSRLLVEGQAYQRDMQTLRRAKGKGWGVRIAVDGQVHDADGEEKPVLYIDTAIDEATRAARFFVELENTLPIHLQGLRDPYVDWKYRPGQRVEVRVPVERFENRLIVPASAVARDGLDNYIFQKSGNMFVRRAVAVEYHDKERVVLGEDARIYEGATIATRGAYQLLQALLNRGRDASAHHGHTH